MGILATFSRTQSSRTQLTPVTIISVYCHLASASGACWQRLKNCGGVSFPQAIRLLNQSHNIITSTGLNLINCNTSIIRHHPHCCYVTYLVQPICTFSCTSVFFINIIIHSILYCTFYLIAHILHFLFYICSLFHSHLYL